MMIEVWDMVAPSGFTGITAAICYLIGLVYGRVTMKNEMLHERKTLREERGEKDAVS